MNIYEKLLKIQTSLKAPKEQYNSFGKYNYRNCEDILEAVKPILNEVKAIVLLGDEVVSINARYYVKATAIIVDVEEGKTISNTAYAREEDIKKGMDGSQITGASSSYARKYALNGLFAIDDNKDSDTTNKGQDFPKQNDEEITKLANELINLFTDEKGKIDQIELNNICDFYKVDDLKKLNNTQLNKLIERRKEKLHEIKEVEV